MLRLYVENVIKKYIKGYYMIKKILKILLGIGITIIIFLILIWLGVKGLIGMIIGLIIMAYLLLSKNTVFLSLIKMTQSEDLLNDIKNGKL